MRYLWVAALALAMSCQDPPPRSGPPRLVLEIFNRETGKQTPARFAVHVDGKIYFPDELGAHGLRFHSVHESKNERLVVTYTRGTGAVECDLPETARRVRVEVAKGFEYFPEAAEADMKSGVAKIRVELRRWADSRKAGWSPCDEHVHYARPDAAGDRDWLTMLAADGLDLAHFMVLKGGKVPGIWGHSHAYGKAGEAFDGERLIRPGEEYRDSAMGHINLLGVREVIPPISTGGMGQPPVRENYPALHDVMKRARELGGLSGVAHGGYLGRHPTAIVDTVLGVVEFFEIANTHLYATDLWYRLLNCGYILPPAGGTDLPNFPFRDAWQPFLGSVRMYAKVGTARDFESWKEAVRGGRVYVTSGPTLTFTVNGQEAGSTIRLPTSGTVTIEGELATPIGLEKIELVRDGRIVPAEQIKVEKDDVHRWSIKATLLVRESSWFALRGLGVPIQATQYVTKSGRPGRIAQVLAHSGIVQVEVGGKPIRSSNDATHLIEMLKKQMAYYLSHGRYEKPGHREEIQALFGRAVAELEKRK